MTGQVVCCLSCRGTVPELFEGRLNLENESGHGKVMEHDKLAKSHGIL